MAATATKQITYLWEGKDKKGKVIKGEMRAAGESFVSATLAPPRHYCYQS